MSTAHILKTDDIVSAYADAPVVHSGDRVAFIAHEWEDIVVG